MHFQDALARGLLGVALEQAPRRGSFEGEVLDLSDWVGQAKLLLASSSGSDGVWGMQVLKPAAVITTFTTAAFDLGDFVGAVSAILNCVKASAGTTPKLNVKVTHCTTVDGTYTDSALAFAEVTDAADIFETLQLERPGVHQFIKFVGTVSGADASFLCELSLAGTLVAVTGTPTLDVAVHHCDTAGGTFVASGEAFAQVTDEEASNQLLSFDVGEFKRFIKLVGVASGGEFAVGAGLIGLERSIS